MTSLEPTLKRALVRLVSFFFSRPRRVAADLPIASLKRILIVRQHDQLGDLLIATPAIRAVRRRFPDAFLAVVAREYTSAVVENNPFIDQVIVFYEKLRRWNVRRAIMFWRALRGGGGFDCAIVLNTISRSLSSDIIALLSGATYIVGPDHLSLDASLPEKIYNVPARRSDRAMSEIERNLEVVQALGATENDFEYDFVLRDEEVLEAERIFHTVGMLSGKKIVGVHFGAENYEKRLPLSTLAQVIDWIVTTRLAEVVLIVSPKEVERREELLSLLRTRVYSAPIMPLRVLAAFMRHLDLFLCNDTGTLHLASSQRVPTVSFHSLGDPAKWKPPHPRHVALRGAGGLISSITAGQIEDAVKSALKSGTRKRPKNG